MKRFLVAVLCFWGVVLYLACIANLIRAFLTVRI